MLQNKAELNRGSFLCNLNNTTSLVEVTTFSFTPSGSYWEWRRSSRHVWCLSDPFKFGYNRKSKHWVDVFSRPRVTALSLVTLLEFFYWQATPFVIRNTTVLIHVLRLVSVGYELFYDPLQKQSDGTKCLAAKKECYRKQWDYLMLSSVLSGDQSRLWD